MSAPTRALPALVAGATLIGLAPIFVRLADVGPSAVAFWRLALALPILLPLCRRERAQEGRRFAAGGGLPWALVLGGLCFAGDLSVWHHSLHWTTVANATLLTNLAPVWVALVAWLVFRERIGGGFWFGLLLTLAGAGVLMADSVRISMRTLLGDGLAIVTSLFYAGYLVVLSRARARRSTLEVMAWTTAVAALAVLPVALLEPQPFWPQSLYGWGIVLGLAWLSHVGGQGLIAWGFAHLPASFSAVTLLIQPVAAALFAWLLLSEAFGWQQALGGAVVLAGILLCRATMGRR